MGEFIIAIVVASVGSGGLASVLTAWLNHKWSKESREDKRIEALVDAQKTIMIDRVSYLGRGYIERGCISLAEKENLTEMHRAYKGLGGNGHLALIMSEVDKLPVSGDEDCGK